jgi:hypothetical protein
MDVELQALWRTITRVLDLVPERAEGTSSLATSLSSVVKLIEDRIDVVAANGVHWGTRSALATNLSHFPELRTELELLGSGLNADQIEGQVNALWTQKHEASDSLVSFVPLSVARGFPDGAGGEEWW